MQTWAKAAIVSGLAVGTVAVLAACSVKEQEPQSTALDKFQPFDRNRDNNFSADETTRFTVGNQYSQGRYYTQRIGDLRMWEERIVHTETTSSMAKAYAAARGNDAIASLNELTALANRFDTDGNGTLSRSERRDFDSEYGPQTSSRTVVDYVRTGWDVVTDPTYPGTPGGPTSPGDDYDYGHGGSGGGTGSGDDYGTGGGTGGGDDYRTGGSGGTAGGDERTQVPTGGTGGSSGSTSSGDSTDNGNPSEDDF